MLVLMVLQEAAFCCAAQHALHTTRVFCREVEVWYTSLLCGFCDCLVEFLTSHIGCLFCRSRDESLVHPNESLRDDLCVACGLEVFYICFDVVRFPSGVCKLRHIVRACACCHSLQVSWNFVVQSDHRISCWLSSQHKFADDIILARSEHVI